MQQGEMVTATQSLSDDMIELFAAEIGAEIRLVDPARSRGRAAEALGVESDDDDDEDDDDPVTPAGHHRHGSRRPRQDQAARPIRNANVVAGEAGGITQHIGAYQVEKNGQPLTFIDTPGHEAFTAMRARGAEATDIVVLVVAADDGVMPQTIEALNHAKAAEVPIVVAVNKIDRENADPNRVHAAALRARPRPRGVGRRHHRQRGLGPAGHGIDELLENLLLVAELEDLRANPEGGPGRRARVHLDIGRGPVATVLVQRGTLRVGDPLVAGAAWGRVRAIIDDHGEQVKEAGPSTPGAGARAVRRGRGRRRVRRRPDEKTCPRSPRPASTGSARPASAARPRHVRRRQARGHLQPRSRPARPPRSTSSSRPT
jgi:translation initiation factor IF-2